MINNISRKEYLLLIGVFIVFILVHLPGLNLPYHQDEYKWPSIVLSNSSYIPHPPIGELIYKNLGKVFGADNFRAIPFIFGILNFFLLFYLVKSIFNNKTALWSVFLFSISFYSLLASFMVDTDGAIMPAFFLISSVGYYGLRKMNFQFSIFNFTIFLIGIIGGFLVKTSFIIAIAAFALDFAIERKVFSDRKKFFKHFAYLFGLGVILALILLLSKLIFPSFHLQSSLQYWEHFAKFGDRGWLQTFIQFAKSILYASPLLIIPAFFVNREIFRKTRPFFLFVFLGLLFYFFAFDFSTGALDRYFQFLIIPLCIISGAIFAKCINSSQVQVLKTLAQDDKPSREIFQQENIRGFSKFVPRKNLLLISGLTVIIFSLQFITHFVPPLYPKTEWISRILSLKWNFLFPFTGGSGPTGFYVSFLFTAIIWILSIIFSLGQKIQNSGFFLPKGFPQKSEPLHFLAPTLWIILILGILYNGMLIEEHLFGKMNGSPYVLFAEAKKFISENKEIKKVVVYNDIGGYEIQKIGKYERRLYAAPQFESTYKDFFKNFSGHILYIDIPKIGENNFYSNYLATCKNIYEEKDNYITAKILECKK